MFSHRATRLGSLCALLALIREAGEQGCAGPRPTEASYPAWWFFFLVTTAPGRGHRAQKEPVEQMGRSTGLRSSA